MDFWTIVLASLAVLFVWGLISPRGQWRMLVSWVYRNPEAAQPSSFAFGVRRLLSGIGVTFFIVLAGVAVSEYVATRPDPPEPLTALQKMWGKAPEPTVVNRLVQPLAAPPAGLVERPIAGYQQSDPQTLTPRYLHLLDHFAPRGGGEPAGLIGEPPARHSTALEGAELVVNVRAWVDCVPREVVVVETEETVQISAYYGLPDRADGTPADHGQCARPAFVQTSALIPISLSAPVGERTVTTLDGIPIREVAAITD